MTKKDTYQELRIKNVKEAVQLRDLITEFNIECESDGETTQLHCPFHGHDNHASARIYDTNSMYCWVCSKSWDVIEFVRDFKDLEFRPAVEFLENKYNLQKPDVSIAYAPEKYEEDPVEEEPEPSETKFDGEFEKIENTLKRNRDILSLTLYSKYFNYLDNLYAEYKLGQYRSDLILETSLQNLHREINSKI